MSKTAWWVVGIVVVVGLVWWFWRSYSAVPVQQVTPTPVVQVTTEQTTPTPTPVPVQ